MTSHLFSDIFDAVFDLLKVVHHHFEANVNLAALHEPRLEEYQAQRLEKFEHLQKLLREALPLLCRQSGYTGETVEARLRKVEDLGTVLTCWEWDCKELRGESPVPLAYFEKHLSELGVDIMSALGPVRPLFAAAGLDSEWKHREAPAVNLASGAEVPEAPGGHPAAPDAPPQERLQFDADTLTVTLDGVPYAGLDPTAFRILEAIWKEPRKPVSQSVLEKTPGLRGKNFPRELKKLPPELQSLIQADRGSGRWVCLPPENRR